MAWHDRPENPKTYNSRSKSHSLRARPNRIRNILDVGAGNAFTTLREYACPHAEFGVWAYSIRC